MASDIPDFAKEWGNVRRADVDLLPAGIDARIALDSIFELIDEDGKSSLVVLDTCDACKKVKQFCSRGYPSCKRCEGGGGGVGGGGFGFGFGRGCGGLCERVRRPFVELLDTLAVHPRPSTPKAQK